MRYDGHTQMGLFTILSAVCLPEEQLASGVFRCFDVGMGLLKLLQGRRCGGTKTRRYDKIGNLDEAFWQEMHINLYSVGTCNNPFSLVMSLFAEN